MRRLLVFGFMLAVAALAAGCIEIQPPSQRATPTPLVQVPPTNTPVPPTPTEPPTRTATPTRTAFPTPPGALTPAVETPGVATPPPTTPVVVETPVASPVATPPVVVPPPIISQPPPSEPVVVVPPAPVIPSLVPTPVSPCLGDEVMTWVPRWPRPNETVVISVTSAKQRRFARLLGPASPELIEATIGGSGYVWRWNVVLARTGTFEFRFANEDNTICASGIIEVLENTPTPTATATGSPIPTNTALPTNTPGPTNTPLPACFGVVGAVVNPSSPVTGQTFTMTFTSPQNNLRLTGNGVQNSGVPVSVTLNSDGTFTSVFQVRVDANPPGQTSTAYSYILFAGPTQCPTSYTVIVSSGTPPTSTPTNTPTGGGATPTRTNTPVTTATSTPVAPRVP